MLLYKSPSGADTVSRNQYHYNTPTLHYILINKHLGSEIGYPGIYSIANTCLLVTLHEKGGARGMMLCDLASNLNQPSDLGVFFSSFILCMQSSFTTWQSSETS